MQPFYLLERLKICMQENMQQHYILKDAYFPAIFTKGLVDKNVH